MKKVISILVVLALLVSCSDDSTTRDWGGENEKSMVGIYKGFKDAILILLPDNRGSFVTNEGQIERFTWTMSGEKTFISEFGDGKKYESDLPSKNYGWDVDFIYRDKGYIKVAGEESMKLNKSLLGKWKVQYSNTINPVFYFKSETELEDIKERIIKSNPNIEEWHWYRKDDMGWNQMAMVKEYNGQIDEPVDSYMFGSSEMAIGLTDDFLLQIFRIDYTSMKFIPLKTIIYLVEDNNIVLNTYYGPNSEGPRQIVKYKYDLRMDGLSIEAPREFYNGTSMSPNREYVISNYSKVQ